MLFGFKPLIALTPAQCKTSLGKAYKAEFNRVINQAIVDSFKHASAGVAIHVEGVMHVIYPFIFNHPSDTLAADAVSLWH